MTVDELERGLQRLNEEDPPDYSPSPFLGIYRHPCMKARIAKKTGRPVSTAIDLKEVYATRWGGEDGTVPEIHAEDETAILFRYGTCKQCGQTARSPYGRFVLTAERPPVYGRVARG